MQDSISQHVAWLRASGASPRTVEAREWCLRMVNRRLPLGLEWAATEELAEILGNPAWSANTLFTYWGHCWCYYHWAADRPGNVLEWNPMEDLKRPRKPRGTPRPITQELLAEILGRACEPYRTFAVLAAYAGLRCKEIAGLHRGDITEAAVYIRDSKGGDPEQVPTHPLVWETVRHFPDGSIPLHIGGWTDAHLVSINWADYVRRQLRLPRMGLHRLRHTFATELRKMGYDLFVIQKLMRHRHISSTEIYVDVADRERRLAVAALPVPTPWVQQNT